MVTADEIIRDHCDVYGMATIFQKGDYRCGSDRCIAAYGQNNLSGVLLLNVQAEQPFLDPNILSVLIEQMKSDKSIGIGSLMSSSQCDSADQHVVKVAVDEEGNALVFTRVLDASRTYHQHIGVYGFRTEMLPALSDLTPSPSEVEHSLEQLRLMHHDISIRMIAVDHEPISIDSPSQLLKIKSS